MSLEAPITKAPKIRTLEEADKFLLAIALMKASVKQEEAKAELRINKINEELKEKTAHNLVGIEKIEEGLQAFAKANKEKLFGGEERSIKLNCGTIGYRESTSIVTTDETIEKLKKMNLYEAITTKENPNKEVLGTFDNVLLKKLGVKKEVTDNFFYRAKEKPLAKVTDKKVSKGKP